MSHSAKAARAELSAIAAAWNQLRDMTHITVIRSDTEYNRMTRLLDTLVDEVGDDESHSFAGLMELVGHLIEQYEASRASLPDLPPREVLRFLMTRHNFGQADLKELGSQGVVSEILGGKREINARQAKALAARFGVSPASFL